MFSCVYLSVSDTRGGSALPTPPPSLLMQLSQWRLCNPLPMQSLEAVDRSRGVPFQRIRELQQWLESIDRKDPQWGSAPDPAPADDSESIAHGCQSETTPSGEQLALFYSNRSPFSNFYRADTEIDGFVWPMNEGFFMYRKAVVFGDSSAGEQIKEKRETPRKAKAIGRRVRNFDPYIWREEGTKAMLHGCYRKFEQNGSLRRALFSTGLGVLVESSPFDRIWGIGLRAQSPKVRDPKDWKGENRLGRILTVIREHMKTLPRYRDEWVQS